MVKIETRCRIPIWRTFGRIQWHVIPEPPATLQGSVTWQNQRHDCATLQGVIIPSGMFKIVFRHILSVFVFLMQFGVWRRRLSYHLRYTYYVHDTIATFYYGEMEIIMCSMCCQKLVVAQKYSAEVWLNFGTRSAPSAKTSASAEHYKGTFGAPLILSDLAKFSMIRSVMRSLCWSSTSAKAEVMCAVWFVWSVCLCAS